MNKIVLPWFLVVKAFNRAWNRARRGKLPELSQSLSYVDEDNRNWHLVDKNNTLIAKCENEEVIFADKT